jgi:hypothetical protein
MQPWAKTCICYQGDDSLRFSPIRRVNLSIFDRERRLLESCAVLKDVANKKANICLGIHARSGAQTLVFLYGCRRLPRGVGIIKLFAPSHAASNRRRCGLQE